MVYIFLANGFETIEALAPVDILKRAGVEAVTVGVGGKVIVSAQNIPVTADITADKISLDDSLDMIVLPGGMPGTLNLEADSSVQAAIDCCVKNDKYIGAICAAPSILGHKGLLDGKEAICYPGFEKDLTGAVISEKYVVQDGKIITARGAGVCVDFGLKLAEVLTSVEKAQSVREGIQCQK